MSDEYESDNRRTGRIFRLRSMKIYTETRSPIIAEIRLNWPIRLDPTQDTVSAQSFCYVYCNAYPDMSSAVTNPNAIPDSSRS